MDYDSDSSGLADQGEYTETNVLLGYASKEPTEDTISHLGGHPVRTSIWMLACANKRSLDMAYIDKSFRHLREMQSLPRANVITTTTQRRPP